MAETVKKTSGRPKKVEEVKEEVLNTEVVEVVDNRDKEIEELRKELARIQKEKEELALKTIEIKEEKYASDDEIEVVSQCLGKLNLVIGKIGENGKDTYTFDDFGDVKYIPYGDLHDILRHEQNLSFAKKGKFYINDEKAIKQLRLDRHYKKMISSDELIDLFEKTSKEIIEYYDFAIEGQKELIVELIMDKLSKKEDIDANVLVHIGKDCGKDLINYDAD